MLKLIKLIIWIAIISGGIFFWQYHSFTTQKMCVDFAGGYLEVEKGWNFRTALGQIYDNDFFIKLYLRENTPDFELQAGKYEIACGDISEIIESLRQPINETDEQITFLEGWNIYDIDITLSEAGLIESGTFSDFATDCEQFCSLKADYPFIADASTLEGFLYPDTYAINPNDFSIESLVRKMLDRFEEKVIDSGIISDMGSIEVLDILTMASIVQKEANKRDNPEEIAIIAGILKKRLDEGWMIGADATICYPYKIATQDCGPDEVLKYLYEKNEYNTRQMVGLPITPIANPEAEVIQSTIQSIDSEYYYYLHDNSGQIHYARTDAEHIRNKNTYLR